KKARKLQERQERQESRAEKKESTKTMPVPALAIKILSVVLSIILVVALTLYVLGKMPARGFFSLAILLAVIAFFVLPWMRKRYAEK
ncbi:hypothetical protein HZB90_01290, partial [archaeon]|nr:hypothetical protein [archaeon]